VDSRNGIGMMTAIYEYWLLLADRTKGRAIGSLLRLSSVVCDVMYCG